MFIHVLYIYSNPRDSRYEIIFNFQSSIFNLLGVAGAPGEGIFLVSVCNHQEISESCA